MSTAARPFWAYVPDGKGGNVWREFTRESLLDHIARLLYVGGVRVRFGEMLEDCNACRATTLRRMIRRHWRDWWSEYGTSECYTRPDSLLAEPQGRFDVIRVQPRSSAKLRLL